jgi:hypothetical protein
MKQELAYCEVVDDEEMFLWHRRFLPVAHGKLPALLFGVDVDVAAGEMKIERGMARGAIRKLLTTGCQVCLHVLFEHEEPPRCGGKRYSFVATTISWKLTYLLRPHHEPKLIGSLMVRLRAVKRFRMYGSSNPMATSGSKGFAV